MNAEPCIINNNKRERDFSFFFFFVEPAVIHRIVRIVVLLLRLYPVVEICEEFEPGYILMREILDRQILQYNNDENLSFGQLLPQYAVKVKRHKA